MIGRVVSAKLKNTVTVLVERESVHPLYKKAFARSKKYQVDDLLGVKLGDIVEICEIRPISKNKYFRIVKVTGRSIAEIAEEQLKEKGEQIIEEVMPEKKEETEELSVISPQIEKETDEKQKKPRKRKDSLKAKERSSQALLIAED